MEVWLPINTAHTGTSGAARHETLPSHLEKIEAGGEVLETTDLFVTLATEKVQSLLPEKALKAVGERGGSTGERDRGERGGQRRCSE